MSAQDSPACRLGTTSRFSGNLRLCSAVCFVVGLCACGGGKDSNSQLFTPPVSTDVRLVSVLFPGDPQPPPLAHAVSSAPRISSNGDFVSFLSRWNESGTSVNTLLSLRSTCVNSAGCTPTTTPVAYSINDVLEGGNAIARHALSANGRYLLLAVFSFDADGETGWAYVDDTCAGVTVCTHEDYDLVPGVYHGAAISASGRFAAFGSQALILHDFCLDIIESCTPGTVWRGEYGADSVAITGEGRYLAFDSTASTIVPNDNNDV